MFASSHVYFYYQSDSRRTMLSNLRSITDPDSGYLPNISIVLAVPVESADGTLPPFVGCIWYTFSGRGDSTFTAQAPLTIRARSLYPAGSCFQMGPATFARYLDSPLAIYCNCPRCGLLYHTVSPTALPSRCPSLALPLPFPALSSIYKTLALPFPAFV
jgi:hypothetical protein